MTIAASSYIPTSGAADTRATEVLSFPFTARPQVMTLYFRFVESGSILSGSAMICHLGSSSDSATPRLQVYRAGGKYRLEIVGDVTVNSTLITAPSIGNVVELRCVINTTVQIHQSINGAAETSATASSAQVLPQTWAGTILYVGSRAGSINIGFNKFLNVCIMRGSQSLTTMRREAGVW